MADQPDQRVNIRALNSAATAAIGLVAVNALQASGVVTLQVGDSGFIELVPAGELELDVLDEASALQELVKRDYTDNQMADYLRQRGHREAWKQQVRQMEVQKRLVEAQSSPTDDSGGDHR